MGRPPGQLGYNITAACFTASRRVRRFGLKFLDRRDGVVRGKIGVSGGGGVSEGWGVEGRATGKKLHEFLKGKGHEELSNGVQPAAARCTAELAAAVTRSYRNSRWFYALCDTQNIARGAREFTGRPRPR